MSNEVDSNTVIDIYKEKLSSLTHENIMLSALLKEERSRLEQEVNLLRQAVDQEREVNQHLREVVEQKEKSVIESEDHEVLVEE